MPFNFCKGVTNTTLDDYLYVYDLYGEENKKRNIRENKIIIDGNRTIIYVRGNKTVVTYDSEREGLDQYDRALGIWLAILKHILYSEVGRKHLWTWFCENVNFDTLTVKKIMDYIQAYRGKELLEWYRNFVLKAHKEGKVFENCKKKKTVKKEEKGYSFDVFQNAVRSATKALNAFSKKLTEEMKNE